MDYIDIITNLRGENLAAVFPVVRQKAASMGNWEVTEEVESLWMTYQQMLQFMLNGVNDPQSEQIRKKVCHKLLLAVSQLQRLERLKNNTSEKYVSTRKSLKSIPSFESIVNHLEDVSSDIAQTRADELMRESIRQHRLEDLEMTHETILVNLFDWTWTSEVWQNGDVEQANRIVFSENISSNDKALFISSVTLSLLEFTDTSKLLFLLDCYLVEDAQVAQRSLVGFVLVFYLFFELFNTNKELLDRLTVYRDDSAFIHDFYSTMMQLQLSCTTDSVTSKMRNDIIPAIMQGQMKYANQQKNVDWKEFTKHGENPEWIDDAKVNKKMREMADLQLDGADIYYSSFAMLKGYPFFGTMSHWFYPFSFDNILVPEIKQVLSSRIGRLMKLMLNGSPFCNSDKYSLCFTFKTLGTMGEAAIESQIQQQLDGENIEELIADAESTKPKTADIRRQYIFDLYRFFYSYPYKLQFINPFAQLKEHPITPFSNDWLTMLLGSEEEEMAHYADFLMRKEFYATALTLFESLHKNEFEEKYASIWQKIGFCHQKLQHSTEAIHAYSIANSLKPNSKWTLSHLASLHFAEGTKNAVNMTEAATYYQTLLEIEPDNMKYLLGLSQALMKCERYDEALQHLYKAHYLDDTSVQTKLLLSWCLIINGQREEASRYILEVQSEKPQNTEAQTLLAFILLIDGKMREAFHQLQPLFTEENINDIKERFAPLVNMGMIDGNTEILFEDALTLHID